MKNIIFTFVLCLFIQGNVSAETTMKLVPQVLKGQKIITQEDAEAIISHKKSSVALRPPPDGYSSEGRPMILVSVYGTKKSFDFSTEDIQVFVDGNPHRVFTYDELVEETKQRQAHEVAAVESKFAALSRDAAEGAYTSSSDPEVFSPSDNQGIVGNTTKYGYKYDVSSVARSQSQINADMRVEKEAIEMRTQKALATLDALMLKKTTVLPNKWHRGFAAIEKIPNPTQPHEVKIVVPVAGEEHEFLLNHLVVQE
jgi:hypothetical protein